MCAADPKTSKPVSAALATSLAALHRFVDSRSEAHDLTAMGACTSLDAPAHARFSGNHATLYSPRFAQAFLDITEPCTSRLLGMDTRLFKWACNPGPAKRTYGLRCANWRQDLPNVSRQVLMERFSPPPVTTFGRKGRPRRQPDRFVGYGYFVQDRVGVRPTLHDVNNKVVLDPMAVVG